MNTPIHLTGQLPGRWEEAMAALAGDLGMTAGETGVEIRCRKGEALSVDSDGVSVDVVWSRPVELYRAPAPGPLLRPGAGPLRLLRRDVRLLPQRRFKAGGHAGIPAEDGPHGPEPGDAVHRGHLRGARAPLLRL